MPNSLKCLLNRCVTIHFPPIFGYNLVCSEFGQLDLFLQFAGLRSYALVCFNFARFVSCIRSWTCCPVSQDATTIILQKCENFVGGRTWDFICFIRYENYSFIGKLDTNRMYIFSKSNVSNPDAFNTTYHAFET